jgi:cytosol alanyl aminopeptidase
MRLLRIVGASVLLALAAAGVRAAEPERPALRLPATARPTSYAADLRIDPASPTFQGMLDVAVRLDQKTDYVWMHAEDLKIEKVSARAGGAEIGAKASPRGEGFLGIALERPVGPGEVTLHFVYTGTLNDTSTTGLFRQKSGDDWYAFSMFESIDARRAFPCFDEPGFKTPWQLTLRIPKGSSAVSNTPIESEKDGPGSTRIVKFKQTRPLPSYLVALGVGPFEYVDAGRAGANKTPLRIVTPRGKASQAKNAAATTGPLLEALEAYFGIPFPYEKLDHVAVPKTVNFGAEENAGLITWSESVLLFPPSEDTVKLRRQQADWNAHEMAHQWFGDLVTLAWWDDVWLNESFATWMSDRTLTEWKPEWNMDVDRVVDRSNVMDLDSLVSSRKIRQEIASADDIANAFDPISYQKGAAVITMFESWIGKDKFRDGVHKYLAAHQYGSATSEDFLHAIEAASSPGVGKTFSTFLDQAGVPLVDVSMDCASGKSGLVLSQKRFLPVGTPGSAEQTWRIPVCTRGAAGGAASGACGLLAEKSGTLPAPTSACPAWLLANAGGRGYYRALYKNGLLPKLLDAADRELSVAERVGVLRDVNALAVGGAMPMADALALVPRFADSPSRPIVQATIRIAADVKDKHLLPEDLKPNYTRFLTKTFGARARQLGFAPKAGEDEDTQLLRASLVPYIAREGSDPELQAEARRLALAWLDDRSAIDASMAGPVLEAAAAHGDRALFDRFKAALPSARELRDRRRLYGALATFPDPQLVSEAFALYLVPQTDAREADAMFFTALQEDAGSRAVWKFTTENYEAILAKMPREATDLLPYAGVSFCDAGHRREVEEFFKTRADKLPGGPRTLAQVLERIDLCIAARAAQEASVREFLKSW